MHGTVSDNLPDSRPDGDQIGAEGMRSLPLSQRIDAVRRAWRRASILAGVATVLAEACLLVLVLVAIDCAYHLEAPWRWALLGASLSALVASAALMIAAPWRRRISDEQVALHIESRVPALAGAMVAAVEIRPGADPLRDELALALIDDCLAQAALVSPWSMIDRRRLGRRALAAGVACAVVLGFAGVRPGLATHEFARVLAPWTTVPMNQAELVAAKKKADIDRRNHEILAEQQAKIPAPIELHVQPGAARVRRGDGLRVHASANRVTEPPTLTWRDSAGQWRTLPMTEDPAHPEAFQAMLPDLTVDTAYAVTMGPAKSSEFPITVYDSASLKHATMVLRYPAYLHLPDHQAAAGAIDAVEGTVVDVDLETSGPLSSGTLQAPGSKAGALTITNAKATGTFTLSADGQWRLSAIDADGNPVSGIEGPWPVVSRRDGPPTIELLYPLADTQVHPMAEIAIAARAEDDIALKEVRLVMAYGLEDPVVVRRETLGAGKIQVAEFQIALCDRKEVKRGDSIVFHVEAVDLKGQVSSSDVYSITVGALESAAHYGGWPETGAKHAPSAPELITLIGASHDLDAKRAKMTDEQLRAECKRIADFLVERK